MLWKASVSWLTDIYQYAKNDQNIPKDLSTMVIYTNWSHIFTNWSQI